MRITIEQIKDDNHEATEHNYNTIPVLIYCNYCIKEKKRY